MAYPGPPNYVWISAAYPSNSEILSLIPEPSVSRMLSQAGRTTFQEFSTGAWGGWGGRAEGRGGGHRQSKREKTVCVISFYQDKV